MNRKWLTDEAILNEIDPFLEVYSQKPEVINEGGMKIPHMFACWVMLRTLRPTHIVESGVWRGMGTWLFRKAAPQAKLICLDPNPHFRYFTDQEAKYSEKDFFEYDWSGIPKDSTLLFFDDHQNALERLKFAHGQGFKHLVFEDNYPSTVGDCYSIKKALAGTGFSPTEAGILPKDTLKRRIRRLFGFKTFEFLRFVNKPKEIPPNVEDRNWIENNTDIYYEFPPVYKTEKTRWRDTWDEVKYPGPQPLFTKYHEKYKLFYEEALFYTWICYVRLK